MPANSAIGLLPSFQQGYRLVDGGDLIDLANMTIGAATGVVGAAAAPGPTLNAYSNFVASGANVTLPAALPGTSIVVLAASTGTVLNAMAVNPSTGTADRVNGAASVTLAGNASMLVCYRLGQWFQLIPTPAGAPTAMAASADEETQVSTRSSSSSSSRK